MARGFRRRSCWGRGRCGSRGRGSRAAPPPSGPVAGKPARRCETRRRRFSSGSETLGGSRRRVVVPNRWRTAWERIFPTEFAPTTNPIRVGAGMSSGGRRQGVPRCGGLGRPVRVQRAAGEAGSRLDPNHPGVNAPSPALAGGSVLVGAGSDGPPTDPRAIGAGAAGRGDPPGRRTQPTTPALLASEGGGGSRTGRRGAPPRPPVKRTVFSRSLQGPPRPPAGQGPVPLQPKG